MKTFNPLSIIRFMLAVSVLVLFYACGNEEEVPPEEEEVEVITDVTVTFTNQADASDIVAATATDPDGEGSQGLQVSNGLVLDEGKTYTLTMEIFNNLETPGEDIGEEIKDEDDEHQFFFSFTDGAFSDPAGDGNIDTASDDINYTDTDDNGNPVGLTTTWTTGSPLTGGSFTVRLQHQPDVKTATSGATDGETDFELTFDLTIQ